MTVYSYRAAHIDGRMIRGTIESDNEAQVTAVLTARGLYAIAISEGVASHSRSPGRRSLAIVFRGIASLVGAGVPLERAIAATEPLASERAREVLTTARARLREGHDLASALSSVPGVIPAVVIGMVRAGERGSQLSAALEQVASHLEQEAELIARLRNALTYPLLLAVTGTVSVFIIALVVVPRFATILSDLGQGLPAATRLLITMSQLFSHFWLPLLLLGLVFIGLIADQLRRPSGQNTLHIVLHRTPFVGRVRQAIVDARVLRALGGMLRSGMPLVRALDASREAAGDLVVSARLAKARDAVLRGVGLTVALEREKALAPNTLQLLKVGEASGRVADMALGAANLAAQEAERGLSALVTILEPALIIAFGGMVAFTAAALLQAVYSLRPGVS